MNPILMQIIIDQAVFLELSGDDIIDPDAAVRQLEGLSLALLQLAPEDRRAFVSFVEGVAAKQQAEGAGAELVSFLKSLPRAFGISD